MVFGALHRTGVAIVLIVALLAPYGRCQAPARATSHDCCAQRSAPTASVKSSCCTFRSELPAIVPNRAVLGPDAVSVSFVCDVMVAPSFTFEAATMFTQTRHTPPPGASVLRI